MCVCVCDKTSTVIQIKNKQRATYMLSDLYAQTCSPYEGLFYRASSVCSLLLHISAITLLYLFDPEVLNLKTIKTIKSFIKKNTHPHPDTHTRLACETASVDVDRLNTEYSASWLYFS